jgi:large exoprotein involved in heme utilization and adhesion
MNLPLEMKRLKRNQGSLRIIQVSMLECLLACGVLLLSATMAQAQVVPDATSENEGSRLVQRSRGGDQIEGGAVRRNNLFHSFSEFSVGNSG